MSSTTGSLSDHRAYSARITPSGRRGWALQRSSQMSARGESPGGDGARPSRPCPFHRCDRLQNRAHLVMADASASVREAVRRVLEEEEFCVDIESSDVASLLIRGRLHPAACVIDHLLPGGALTAIRRLRAARGGSAPIILIGPREHDETSLAAVRAGCSAVVPRTA